jgi:SAM-dependent methyltransferase
MVFDPLASQYDETFTETAIGRYLRARVQQRLERHFHAGDHVLELGCGTGEDALILAQRGVRVTATDASPAMLEIARQKTAGNSLVRVETLDLQMLRTRRAVSLPITNFDGAFANFGPLNILNDWRPLAEWLSEQVRPGGMVGFGLMGPLCLWEIAWHSLHGDFKTALRRLNGRADFEGAPVYYPRPSRLSRDFAPWFRHVHIEPLGLFLPPSDAFGVVERRPRPHKNLTTLEDQAARFGLLAQFADHYWIDIERR